jgi:hypothetical protein
MQWLPRSPIMGTATSPVNAFPFPSAVLGRCHGDLRRLAAAAA